MAEAPAARVLRLRNSAALEQYSVSSLVDVAFIRAVGADAADVHLESGTTVRNPEDRCWLAEILRTALSECGEPDAQIEFLEEAAPGESRRPGY